MDGKKQSDIVIGVISDTHNHLYPDVKELLSGVDHIIHAGDVCTGAVLSELHDIAPVTLARGNSDMRSWASFVPMEVEVELGGLRILVGHIVGPLRARVATRSANSRDNTEKHIDIVVSGHTHKALMEEENGVLYLNPGSAGPRSFGRPRTMAFLRIPPTGAGDFSANIVVLED